MFATECKLVQENISMCGHINSNEGQESIAFWHCLFALTLIFRGDNFCKIVLSLGNSKNVKKLINRDLL